MTKHPKDRRERLEQKVKLEDKHKKPRSIRGKIKDAIKEAELQDELQTALSQ